MKVGGAGTLVTPYLIIASLSVARANKQCELLVFSHDRTIFDKSVSGKALCRQAPFVSSPSGKGTKYETHFQAYIHPASGNHLHFAGGLQRYRPG